MKIKLLIVAFLLTAGFARGQHLDDNWDIFQYAHTINYPDHKVVFHLGATAENKTKLSALKNYTWYSANQLHITQGGFSGKPLQGDYKDYYNNGNLKETGRFKDGLKIGLWKNWGENGQLESTQSYSKGILSGVFNRFGQDGKLITEGRYANGLLHGKVLSYPKPDSVAIVLYKRGVVVEQKPFWLKRLWKKVF